MTGTTLQPIAPPPMPPPPPAPAASSADRLARGLSTALIIYGAVGLAAALVGLIALSWLSGQMDALGDRASTAVITIADTLDDTATALEDSAETALSAAVTLERTPPIIRQTATTLGNLRENLLAVEGQLAAIQILGARPLANVAALVGDMATDLEGLDTRLALVADDVEANSDALLANSQSLRALGERLGDVAERLRTELVGESLDDLKTAMTVLALLLVAWMAVPAGGALGVGIWLRREVRRA